jgi:hypothetical protein
VDTTKWLPFYRFSVINGNISLDILKLSRLLATQWRLTWRPDNTMVVDESIYEFLGESPCHAYIPRKPHPNGLLSYGLSGYTSVLRLPMLLDVEPWIAGNKLTPRNNGKALVARAQASHPDIAFHIVMDSAFGSFSDVSEYHSKGVLVTMSMMDNKKPWLWSLLKWVCPLESGRVALCPIEGSDAQFLASIYRTQSDSGKMIDIRTVSSAFSLTPPAFDGDTVVSVGQRRALRDNDFEYWTTWTDGDETWQRAASFMDPDGTFVYVWLKQAGPEDIRAALKDLTQDELTELCDLQHWKVNPFLVLSAKI